MGAGDLNAATMEDIEAFRLAGRALFSLGLVRGAEGNLSVFDGRRLSITRTGVSLQALGDDDVLTGGLDDGLPAASSDLAVHRDRYRERGPGAIVHAHPAGTVPEGDVATGQHGVYVFVASLEEAVAEVVRSARARNRT